MELKAANSDVVLVSEAARRLKLSEGFVYELVRTGKLPRLSCGGAVRIPRQAFERLIAEGDNEVK